MKYIIGGCIISLMVLTCSTPAKAYNDDNKISFKEMKWQKISEM